jgi:hypothetical protein
MVQDILHFVIQLILSITPGTDELSRVTPDNRYILHDNKISSLALIRQVIRCKIHHIGINRAPSSRIKSETIRGANKLTINAS